MKDKNSTEKLVLLDELFTLRKEDKKLEVKLQEKLDRMTEQLLALNENSRSLTNVIEVLMQTLSEHDALIEKHRKENVAL